jgi:hypothetical protein
MPRTGLAYERPSRASQALIIGFSLALVVMAGWLVMIIMFPGRANTMAADPAEAEAIADAQSPRLENLAIAPPRRATDATSPSQQPSPSAQSRPAAPFAVTRASPPSGALPLTSPLAQPASPDATDFRGSAAEDPRLDTPAIDSGEVIPLPPPKPRRTAAIPVPRPRPQIDEASEQPQDKTFFDNLVDRMK